jgi:hypothetical protein
VRTEVSAELASDLFDEVHPSEPSGSSSLIDEAPQAAATIEGDTAHSIEVSASVASDTAPETSDAFRRAATVGLTSSRSDAPELSSPAGVPPEAPPMDVAIGAALFDEAPPAIVPPAIVARPSLGMRLAMLGVGAVAGAIFVALALAVTGTFGPLMARMGLRSQSVETSVESTR